MNREEKSLLTSVSKENYFGKLIEKMICGKELTKANYSMLLSSAIVFSQNYNKENNKIGLLQFSYFIILNYFISTGDYKPLLMFSVNNGLYPIAKSIYSSVDIIDNFEDEIIENAIDSKYRFNDFYLMSSQKRFYEFLKNEKNNDKAFIAPTSYGKSSAIINDINNNSFSKIGIIVPKKCLIWQSFRSIKSDAYRMNYRVLLFDSDYNNEERFIAVFTQERAIRLLEDSKVSFDMMYIDEAHNLFSDDERTIILARLIELNKKMNPMSKVMYLSPLINESSNLLLNKNNLIKTFKIDFNIKDFKVHYYDRTSNLYFYNRFFNCFYDQGKLDCKWEDYLFSNLSNKNLVYLSTPKGIENFAKYILDFCNNSKMNFVGNNREIIKIKTILEKYVHESYKQISLLNYGIIYIHGKMNDNLRDYLLQKYKSCSEIKILISNSSILEGINLPIDALFCVDLFHVSKNDLINLCGRVNRLNEIFKSNDLSKLLCKIYFIENQFSKCSLKNKIELLRDDIEDELKNPLLINTKYITEKGKRIKENESNFINNLNSDDLNIIFIKNNLDNYYNLDAINFDIIAKRISENSGDNNNNLVQLIFNIFIKDLEDVIIDKDIKMLAKGNLINWYSNYVATIFNRDYKTKIKINVDYFKEHSYEYFFIGDSFGECCKNDGTRKCYFIPKGKKDDELVNLAIIKVFIDESLITFKLAKYVKTLLDLNVIDLNKYNSFMFGTEDLNELRLLKLGLNKTLLNFISEHNLKDEIKFENGFLIKTDKLMNEIDKSDDYIKFEFNKVLFNTD